MVRLGPCGDNSKRERFDHCCFSKLDLGEKPDLECDKSSRWSGAECKSQVESENKRNLIEILGHFHLAPMGNGILAVPILSSSAGKD